MSSGDALAERLSGAGTVLLLDNCEHVVGQVAALVGSLLAAVPHLRVLATSQVPLGVEDEYVHALEPLGQDDSVRLFTPSGPAAEATAGSRPRRHVGDRGRVPIPGRPAAGDRAGRVARALAVGAGHRPPPGRPVRVAARPQQPATRETTRALGRDRVELRAAVPRRPAWAVGAVVLRRQCLARRDRARPGGPRCACRFGAGHDQPVGRSLAGQR